MRPGSIPPISRCAALIGALALGMTFGTVRAAAGLSAEREADLRRTLTLLGAVAEEYREAVVDRQVVQPVELEEAGMFLEDAQRSAERAAGEFSAIRTAVLPLLIAARESIDARADSASVDALLVQIQQQLSDITGVAAEATPPGPPSVQRGARLFAEHCVSCHGVRGDGKGEDVPRLERLPASFVDVEFMRAETPADFFHVISLGRARSGMPAWEAALSVQERWDLVSYLWTLAVGVDAIAEGQGIYLSQCGGCHGPAGDGRGAWAAHLLKAAPDLTDLSVTGRKTDAEWFAVVSEGLGGSPMPGFARVLEEDERWKVVGFTRMLALGGPASLAGGAGPQRSPGSAEPADRSGAGAAGVTAMQRLQQSRQLLDAALRAYAAGDARAQSLVSEAYLAFDPVEKLLATKDAELSRRMEGAFLGLRGLLRTPGNLDTATAARAAIHADMDSARGLLGDAPNRYALFVQSATIILREGFEVVLIIGALLGYALKSGSPRMQRPILLGTAAGIVCSLVTAYILLRLLHGGSAAAAEAIEGVTLLLAAVVLFWVSYWLISKSEAARWQRFIQGKVQAAVSSGSLLTLVGAAFLAVYREGVETVLFYRALFGSAAGDHDAVIGGLALGSGLLVLVYLAFRRFGMRMPLRQFFLGTSILLYVMAFTFAGRGIAELQGAGWIAVTPVNWMPRIAVLGISPTVETLLAQSVLLALVVLAVGVVLRRRAAALHRESEEPAVLLETLLAEVRRLHLAVAELRRTPSPAGDVQIETLIEGVSHLERRIQERSAFR